MKCYDYLHQGKGDHTPREPRTVYLVTIGGELDGETGANVICMTGCRGSTAQPAVFESYSEADKFARELATAVGTHRDRYTIHDVVLTE